MKCKNCPWDCATSLDIFQEKMSMLMDGLKFVQHTSTTCLSAGLKFNANKCYFAHPELEYLGYIINCNGIKPSHKKVEAIQNIAEPKTCKQLHGFIGLVNYNHDMWIRQSHVLAPRTSPGNEPTLTGRHFHEAKKIIAHV
jgi:hypothetical protein